MPGWHAATKELLDSRDDVVAVGLIQEQHPDRCALFMQWKQIDWPIMVDSFNELGVMVVPITVLIDEYGIVRAMPRSRNPEQTVREFLAADYGQPEAIEQTRTHVPDIEALRERANQANTSDAWRALGTALAKWHGEEGLGDAINALRRSVEIDPDNAAAHFQLGVAYRKRVESMEAQPGDFQAAAEHWSEALALNPDQYIWRRRIQQYGPRLDKPYAFYDWVQTARTEIAARGNDPVKLLAEPSGAEIAFPQRAFESASDEPPLPENAHQITAIEPGLIRAEVTVVPAVVAPGQAVRLHVTLDPVDGAAHWNNEVEPLRAWIQPPSGWEVDRSFGSSPMPKKVTSKEARTIEFELHVPEDAPAGQFPVRVVALYHMCMDEDGVCLYRRHDIEAMITVVDD